MKKIKTFINYNNFSSGLLALPIVKYYARLKAQGIFFRFSSSKKFLFDDSDEVWISSRWLEYNIKTDDNWDYLEWIIHLQRQGKTIKFFDLSDSAGNLWREILPLVDHYYKTYLYKDFSIYNKHLVGGRYFTDLLYENIDFSYQHSLEHIDYNSSNSEHFNKLKHFWNHAFLYCDDFYTRLIGYGKITRTLLKKLPHGQKSLPFSGRFNTRYRHKIIQEYRIKFNTILNQHGISTRRLPLKDFIEELLLSKVCFSPYGWGEFAYRDYEAWIAKCALVKPNMSNINTYPQLYFENKNYIPINIDLSNLEETIINIKNGITDVESIAQNGHDYFMDIIKKPLGNGSDIFFNKLIEIIHE